METATCISHTNRYHCSIVTVDDYTCSNPYTCLAFSNKFNYSQFLSIYVVLHCITLSESDHKLAFLLSSLTVRVRINKDVDFSSEKNNCNTLPFSKKSISLLEVCLKCIHQANERILSSSVNVKK
jgi:hypothetical protein